MPIESSVEKISDLNPDYPLDSDGKNFGANHLRNLKTAMASLEETGANKGAQQVGFLDDGDDAVGTTVQEELRRVIYPERYGVVGDGVTDDTDAWGVALDASAQTGKLVYCTGGKTYLIAGTITPPAGSGIDGDGSCTFLMDSAHFTNTTYRSLGDTSVGILCTGLTTNPYTPLDRPVVKGVKITCEYVDGRWLVGIGVRNCTKPDIDVEVYGLPSSDCVRVDSCTGGRIRVNAHDCTANLDLTPAVQQINGLIVDEAKINSVGTSGVKFYVDNVKDCKLGAVAAAAHGQQSDAVNVQVGANHNVFVTGTISGVGEGYDIFGHENTVLPGNYSDIEGVCVKLIHGASRNYIQVGNVESTGYAAVAIWSGGTTGDPENNVIENINLKDINALGAHGTWAAPVLFGDNTQGSGGMPTYVPKNNIVRGIKVHGDVTNITQLVHFEIGEGNVVEDIEPHATVPLYALGATRGGTGTIRNKDHVVSDGARYKAENHAAAADEKIWDEINDAGTLKFRARNDDDDDGSTWMSVSRTGDTADEVTFSVPVNLILPHGIFTPGLTLGGGSTGMSKTAVGEYERFGEHCFFTANIVLSAKGSSTGALLVTGLPFTAGASYIAAVSVYMNNVTSGVGDTSLMGFVLDGTSTLRIDKMSGGTATQLTHNDITDTTVIRVSGIFKVA